MLNIVVFTKEWLGGGQILDDYMTELAKVCGNAVKFHRVDVEESSKYKEAYGVSRLPTTLFFRNGEIVDYFPGLIAKRKIKARIEALLRQAE